MFILDQHEAGQDTERTWHVHEQRPSQRVSKRSVLCAEIPGSGQARYFGTMTTSQENRWSGHDTFVSTEQIK